MGEELQNDNISQCRYILESAYQTLVDEGTTDPNTIYVVRYDNIPSEISDSPVLEVFIGNSRVSAIINLDTLPEIDDTKYININNLRDGIQDLYNKLDDTIEKSVLETELNNTIDEVADADVINSSSAIPSGLGISNKLYLYFDKASSKYEMFIFHPKLKKFIPLRLVPAEDAPITPTPTPPPTPSTTKLTLEYSTVVTNAQVSQLNIVGDTYMIDLDSMSTIKFGKPGNPIVVQGKFAFWSFDTIEEYIRTSDEICKFITYNNCNINFYINNTLYETSFISDFMSLEYVTYTNASSQTVTNYFITTNNVFNQVGTAIPYSNLTKLAYAKPGNTSWIDDEQVGYGTFGFTILAQSVQSPSVDPTNCPYGFVYARLYFTITGQRCCTTLENCIKKLNGDISVDYDSYLEVKIPFSNINEYYFSKGLITTSEVVINNA